MEKFKEEKDYQLRDNTDPQYFQTRALRENGDKLIGYIRIDDVLHHLLQEGAVDLSEKQDIRAEVSEYKQVARMLEIIDKKPDGVQNLRQSLINSGQDVIAQLLD